MKKIKISLFASMLFSIYFFLPGIVNAQYEQKVTLHGSLGYVSALSPDWFNEYYPNGASIDAGIQYNFSRKFSLAILANSSVFFGLNEFTETSEIRIETSSDYYQLGISLAPKFRFLTSKRVNPYVLGGVSLNLLSYDYLYQYWEYDGSEWDLKEDEYESEVVPATFGFIVGAGIDFRLTDNFAVFIQSGVSSVWDMDEVYPEFLNSFYTQLGVNISLFKSKSL